MDEVDNPLEMNFCRRCGERLTNVERHVYKCANGHVIFANRDPSVGVFFITPDKHVLLSVRGIEPHKGKLDAFGGFLDQGETFEAAAIRELSEELSLEPEDYEELRYLGSALGDYPYKDETIQVITVLFWTKLTSDKPLKPDDDVFAVRSLPLHQVDFAELHDDDIRVGIQRLQQLFP